MNYHVAMQEVYTTSQLTRPSWGASTFIFMGIFSQDAPYYDADGTTVLYTLPTRYSGVILSSDGVLSAYTPSEEDSSATDWDYWNPSE